MVEKIRDWFLVAGMFILGILLFFLRNKKNTCKEKEKKIKLNVKNPKKNNDNDISKKLNSAIHELESD